MGPVLDNMRKTYGETLVELGRERKDMVVLDADLSESTQTHLFAKAFPERFFNFGVAEQNMMAAAAGLATCGKLPVVSTFSLFASMRAVDQVRTSIAYPRLNVKIVATHCGLDVGEAGVTHQSIEDIAIMRSIPGMVVLSPADAAETRYAVRASVELDGPVYIRIARSLVPRVNPDDYQFRLGEPTMLKPGRDVALVATGVMVSKALQAAEKLASDGVQAAVINVHTIKPFCTERFRTTLGAITKVVTVEDHNVVGGLGSAVLEAVGGEGRYRIARVGVPDTFAESGKPDELFEKYDMGPASIVRTAKQLLQ